MLPEAHRDDSRCRRVRGDPHAGPRPVRHARGLDARDDPLRTDDRGRAVRHGDAAQAGVRVENTSATDPLVILKHFGPDNPDAEPFKRSD